MRTDMSTVKDIAARIHDAIDSGVRAAEDVHRSIAKLQMVPLDRIEVLQEPMQSVHDLRNRSIGALYTTIRDINRRVERFTTELLA